MKSAPIATFVKHSKKTLEIVCINLNEPSPEALARAAAKIQKLRFK